MKILYISSEYPPETGFGGIGTYTKYMAEAMVARGHEVSVITLSTSADSSTRTRNGVTLYRIPPVPYPLPPFRWAYPVRRIITRLFPHSLNRISWAIAVRIKIIQLLSKNHFTIIESPECGAEGLLIPRLSKTRYIVRLHTPWVIIRQLDHLPETIGDRFFLPLLETINARRATALSSPSAAMARIMQDRWCFNAISVIHNPLPVEMYEKTQGKTWIFIGRIEFRKGVHLLIKAYIQAAKTTDLPILHLYGGAYGKHRKYGDYGDYINSLIKSSNLQQKIRWAGHVHHENLRKYIQNASVAFFPSLWENFPYSCLEAMACGCLVVASNCGGFPEIIEHNKTGFLTTPGSVESLKKVMIHIVKYQNRLQEVQYRCRESVNKTVGATGIAEHMEKFYTGKKCCTANTGSA